jgi:hypothetical protein
VRTALGRDEEGEGGRECVLEFLEEFQFTFGGVKDAVQIHDPLYSRGLRWEKEKERIERGMERGMEGSEREGRGGR